ncbi:DUF58 domain-containing protein [Candidatus Dojkabacteria bacterium]|nr:DUF58 domain-containing protein [Candidatus Dojkabacteria bacterium]
MKFSDLKGKLNRLLVSYSNFRSKIYPFSFWGAVLDIACGVIWYMIFMEFSALQKLILDAFVSEEKVYFYTDFPFSTLLVSTLIFFGIYVLIFWIIIFFVNIHASRILKKGNFFIDENSNLHFVYRDKVTDTLNVFDKVLQGRVFSDPGMFVSVFGILDLENLSAGGFIVDSFSRPVGRVAGNQIQFDFRPLKSGKYRIRKIILEIKDPFGIFKSKIEYLLTSDHVIIINKYKKIEFDNKIRLDIENVGNSYKLDPLATEGFFKVKNYVFGDDIRRVHWKNSAKTGKLMVRLPEEISINDNVINLVVNLYNPFCDRLDFSKTIGRFLNETSSVMNYLTNLSEFSFNLFINSKEKVILKDFEQKSISKISYELINHSTIQKETCLKSFIMNNELRNCVVFSMTSDDLDFPEVRASYVHRVSYDLESFGSVLKQIFTIEHLGNVASVDMWQVFRRNNPIAVTKKIINLDKCEKFIYKKERKIKRLKNLIFMNDVLKD